MLLSDAIIIVINEVNSMQQIFVFFSIVLEARSEFETLI